MIGSTLLNRYLINTELGQGGMGVVYRAHDTLLNRLVAVKVLSAAGLGTAGRARLLAEARAAAKLNHPNIVTIHDVGEADPDPAGGAGGAPFIVMELVEGSSLRDQMPKTLAEALAIAWQVCAALEHAHSHGVIHRDLKLENVVLTRTQTAKLMDFGLARSADASAPQLTEEGAIVGTFTYLAPELLLGQPASAQSDLYALGVLLYELTTGRPPFAGDNLAALVAQHLQAEPAAPRAHNPEISPDLDALILKLLRKQPADRPTSAADVAQSLERMTPTPALSGLFPARIAAPTTNLPTQLSKLIGREKEIVQLKKRLAESRLVTLTGSGGIGKTRLSIQAAREVLSQYPNGVWLVELAPLADPALVPQAVCTVFDVRPQGNTPPLTALTDYLREKTLLLVLDNCEHMIDACAQLAEHLLTHCPEVRLLASSREALGIEGEAAVRVPSLSLPPAEGAIATRETLAASEAVQLFVERAMAALPGFALTDTNAPAVAQVCRRLDGIALAIELAAARVKMLKVEQIAARLDDAFRLLTGGSRTALPRQQTLRATLDWSYSLLSDSERVLLRRLSVFAGGWTLDAAESVCAGEGVDDYGVLDLLTQLANKSLVVVERGQGEEARYFLLETTRQYAREKLFESTEGNALRGRHLDFYLALAEEIEAKLKTAERLKRRKQLKIEHDNFRAALDWALVETQTAEAEKGLRLASALKRLWHWGGYYREGRAWLEKGLALADSANFGSTAIRAKALYTKGYLVFFQGDEASARPILEEGIARYRKTDPLDTLGLADALSLLAAIRLYDDIAIARSLNEESIALCRALGPSGKWDLGAALYWNGHIAYRQGDNATARSRAEESQALYRQTGDVWETAAPLNILGNIALRQGDYAAARAYYEESLRLWQEAEDKWAVAASTDALGDIDRVLGDYAAASARYEESLKLWLDMGAKGYLASTLRNLGIAALHLGNYQRATELLVESLPLLWERRADWIDDYAVALNLVGLSELARALGQRIRAARLLGAAETIVASFGSLDLVRFSSRVEYERLVVAGRAQLDEAAWAEGQAMTMEQAIEYALKEEA